MKVLLREQLGRLLLRRVAPMALTAVLLAGALQWWSTFTMAYAVSYDGNEIGYVTSEAEVADACRQLTAAAPAAPVSEDDLSCSLRVVSADSVGDADELCRRIVQADDDLTKATGLLIDGELVVACRDEAQLSAALTAATAHYASAAEDVAVITNDITTKPGIYAASTLCESVTAEQLLPYLTVSVTRRERFTEPVPYETEERKTATLFEGATSLLREGKAGEKTGTADVCYVNGKEQSRTVITEKITRKPTARVVLVGTRPRSASSAVDILFWPVAGSNASNVSSYFGDGRNHKGTDILSPNGTPICAAEAGVVSYVGVESGYGNYLVIDHGDGMQTLYAHCSSISAKEGQSVARGEVIAAVGITGRASAYHCHFEVRLNGTAVNAAPYLGIG